MISELIQALSNKATPLPVGTVSKIMLGFSINFGNAQNFSGEDISGR